jgi:hypothetical protein
LGVPIVNSINMSHAESADGKFIPVPIVYTTSSENAPTKTTTTESNQKPPSRGAWGKKLLFLVWEQILVLSLVIRIDLQYVILMRYTKMQ